MVDPPKNGVNVKPAMLETNTSGITWYTISVYLNYDHPIDASSGTGNLQQLDQTTVKCRIPSTLTPFFIGGSVFCATNTVVRSFLGPAMLCSFCSPETQHFQKNNSFSFFTKKSQNQRCKSHSFIGIHWNY